MTHVCKGKCNNYEQCGNREFPYERGFKFCKTCDIYMKYEGNYCPCCSYRIRSKNRLGNHNKWTYESWNIKESIRWFCVVKIQGQVLKVET